MLLSASPHPNTSQCTDTYDALSTTYPEGPPPSAPHGSLLSTQLSTGSLTMTSLASAHAPTNYLHTPQQLAQLDALARAQNRDKPESAFVPEDEKVLCAQLAYLASQHQASEYNRQKPTLPGAPAPVVYIPLSIQLPTHVLELRTRQKESSLRQAWFIAPSRNDEPSHSETANQIQLNDEMGNFSGERGRSTSEPALRDLETSRSYECLSYSCTAAVEVELLQDALGNSVFPVSQPAPASKEHSPKLTPTALPFPRTQPTPRVVPAALDPDVVETPPPLVETALPQFPSPARSRAPSQSLLGRPVNLPDTLLPPHSADRPMVSEPPRGLHSTTKSTTLLVPDDRPTLWPPPPIRPAAVHVAPPPSPQLQLALETAISKDTIIDPNWFPWGAQGGIMPPLGVSGAPVMQNRGLFGPPSPARGSLGLSTRPPMLVPPPPIPKTSETHPINISQVIPSEYIHAISSHLETYPATEDETRLEAIVSRGSYFRIDPYLRLDRIIYTLAVRAMEARAAMAKYSPAPVRVKFAEGIPGTSPALFMGPGVRTSSSEPNFDRPLKRPLSMTSPMALMTPSAKRMEPSPVEPPRMPNQFVPNMLNLDLRGNDVLPLDMRRPDPLLSDAPHNSEASKGDPTIRVPERPHSNPHPPIALPVLPPFSRAALGHPSAVSLHSPLPPSQSLPNLHSPSPGVGTPIPSPPNGDFMLGNLYLSSCPGKKVRLNGPIRGRGAICRNLGADLARVRSTGVHLIICCLDDDEMEFLGAPWPEYKEAAAAVGLDVLRLPMPEGLCPLSVQAMSQHMDRIIYTYTLNGRHVLVHCRGGVGRAGLVACTWMLKLGICGSVEPASTCTIEDPRVQSPAGVLMQDQKVSRDSMELLERVIYIIRRQRSVKAIETYEQVRFLLEFIEYLRDTDAKTLEALS